MSRGESELVQMAGEGPVKKNRGHCCCCVVCSGLLVVALVVCVATPLLYVEVIQPDIQHMIDQNVLLTNGSAGLSQFVSSKAPLYSNYYIFSLSNPDAVKSGTAHPLLNQVGPFVYKENRTKVNLSWEDLHGGVGTQVLKFDLLINYTFQPHLSYGFNPNTTKITCVNLPLIGVLRELEALDKNSRGFRYIVDAVDLVIEHAMSGEGLFVTKTVHELLWGYKDNLLSDIKGIQDEVNKRFKTHYQFVTSDWFGLGQLSSVEAPNRVYTGVGDVRRVGSYIEWNNQTSISGWGTPKASEIRGTGGFLFYPGVTRAENLTSFISELYRSGYFSYSYDSNIYGVTLYNFCLPKEELLNTTADPGFYANGPSGVLNITAVAPGHVPLFVSKPHFLDADPDYLANVSGLHPNRAEHDSYVGVEPITGAVLDAAKRLQVNLRLTRFSLPQLSHLRDITMLPVYWVAQTGKIPSDLAQEFRTKVYGPVDEISGGVYGFIGFSVIVALLCAVSVVSLLVCMIKRSKTQRRGRNINNDESSPLLH